MVVPDYADVVVVGGGPAGSATATHLARAGLDVALLDKASFPREKACAEYCSPGVVDALDDLGALPAVRERPHRELPAMQVVARGQPLPLDFSVHRPDGNLALGIRRSDLDDALLRHAERHGAGVFERVRATQPLIENDRVVGIRCRTGADERSIRAGFVVAADGLHSPLARSLGLDMPVHWPRRLGLVARFRSLVEPVGNGQMHIADGVYSGVSPVGGDEVNVSLVVPLGSKPKQMPTADFYESMLERIPGVRRLIQGAERVTRVRGLGPMAKRVRRRSGPGYVLVGDAAGFLDPLTGEGIHRALRGAELAAEHVLRVLQRPEEAHFDYDAARERCFADKERVCQLIQLMTLSAPVLRYVASRANTRERVHETLTGILGDYTPAHVALHPGFLRDLFRP